MYIFYFLIFLKSIRYLFMFKQLEVCSKGRSSSPVDIWIYIRSWESMKMKGKMFVLHISCFVACYWPIIVFCCQFVSLNLTWKLTWNPLISRFLTAFLHTTVPCLLCCITNNNSNILFDSFWPYTYFYFQFCYISKHIYL